MTDRLREASTGVLREWDRLMRNLSVDPLVSARPSDFINLADEVRVLRAALDSIEEGSRPSIEEARAAVAALPMPATFASGDAGLAGAWMSGQQDALAAIDRLPASPSREGAGLDERMLRWVAAQPIGYGDWACRDCRPDSDMLVGGFRCMVHEARARLTSEEQREDGG